MVEQSIPLYLHGFDPNAPVLEALPESKPWEEGQRRHYVVQFKRDLGAKGNAKVKEEFGLRLQSYIPDFAYIEYLDEGTVDRLGQHELVERLFPLGPEHKIAPGIGSLPFRSEGRKALAGQWLRAVLYPEADIAEVERQLADLGVDRILRSSDGKQSGAARIEFIRDSSTEIARIAELEMVSWIEEVPEIVPNAGNPPTIPDDILDSGTLNGISVLSAGLRGKNQVIGVIDEGSLNVGHCWFRDNGNPVGPAHRKVLAVHDVTGQGNPPKHAVFVCGILAGDDDANPGMAPLRGIASDAKFTYGNTRDFRGDTTPATLRDYLDLVALDGTPGPPLAYIINTSWHSSGNKQYSGDAVDVDAFTWENEECLVVASAANTEDQELAPPAVAKNSISVGAAYVDATVNPPLSCLGDGFPGPTGELVNGVRLDNRRKPDLLAAGCRFLSADTLNPSLCGTNTEAGLGLITPGHVGCKPANVVCATSFATPVVSAAAAIVRQYFSEGRYPSGKRGSSSNRKPSAALIKAALLNATEKPSQSGDYPTNEDGWGLLQLDRILRLPGGFRKIRVWDVRNDKGVLHGQSRVRTVRVTNNNRPLKITLVWTDRPGDPTRDRQLVNNLDLTVTSLDEPGGPVTYLGNVFQNGASIPGGVPDECNNVEMVLIPQPHPGRWRITVTGTHVLDSTRQGFALVVRGNIE